MSLILLFLPHGGTPPITQGAFTPGVIQAIETLRPTLVLVETAEGEFTTSTIPYSSSGNTYNTGVYGGANNSLPQVVVIMAIDTVKPTLVLVEVNLGEFEESIVPYSSSSNTYNTGVYGGADADSPVLATLKNIDTIRPTIDNINKF